MWSTHRAAILESILEETMIEIVPMLPVGMILTNKYCLDRLVIIHNEVKQDVVNFYKTWSTQ